MAASVENSSLRRVSDELVKLEPDPILNGDVQHVDKVVRPILQNPPQAKYGMSKWTIIALTLAATNAMFKAGESFGRGAASDIVFLQAFGFVTYAAMLITQVAMLYFILPDRI